MSSEGIARLCIVSHVTHYRHQGRLFAYGPYVREIDLWAELFREVVIASPCREEPPPGDALPFEKQNISILPQPETGGHSITAKVKQLALLLPLVGRLLWTMRQADAVHVRCPGNLGLLGVLLAPLASRYLIAKYAGQWTGYPGEARTFRLQRTLLASPWWRGPVTVYGRWPGQPPHVVPFFTSVLTEAQMERAQRAAAARRPGAPLRILFVGRLSMAKNVHVLLEAAARLSADDVPVQCVVAGEGPERGRLEALAESLGIGAQVEFRGGLEFEQVLRCYEDADVLVLASETEGWPKAIAEAMAFGLVCVGSNRGLVPEMLGEGRGYVVPPGDVEALSGALSRIAASPEETGPMAARAAEWGQRFSTEGLRDAIRTLLVERWGVPLVGPASVAPAERG